MKIVMKTLFEKHYQRSDVQFNCLIPIKNCENTGPVAKTEEDVVSLYDLPSHRT